MKLADHRRLLARWGKALFKFAQVARKDTLTREARRWFLSEVPSREHTAASTPRAGRRF